LIAPKLKEATKDIKIDTPNPTEVAYLLRNASALEEFNWITKKFTLRVKENYLLCKIRELEFKVGEDVIVEKKEEIEEKEAKTFLEIFNYLFNYKPSQVSYINILEPAEIERLRKWCSNNNYKLEDTSTVLTFIKIKEE
jgi:hypothetical protein